MKTDIIIYILLAFLLIIQSCSDHHDETPSCTISGSVIGDDSRRCGCCPGWLVKNGLDTFKFETVPDNLNMWDLVNFYGYPIPIKFNYVNDTGYCSDSYKLMTCIKLDIDMNCTKSGEIINYNSTECSCCPGWIIKTGIDTIKILKLPIESQVWDLVEESGFPISIKLDYEDNPGFCEDSYKKLTCIELSN